MTMSEQKFRFWGTKSDGTRDLIGWAKADTISEALDGCAVIVGETRPDYDKIEIVKIGSKFDDA
jgi:hypothetical protein